MGLTGVSISHHQENSKLRHAHFNLVLARKRDCKVGEMSIKSTRSQQLWDLVDVRTDKGG